MFDIRDFSNTTIVLLIIIALVSVFTVRAMANQTAAPVGKLTQSMSTGSDTGVDKLDIALNMAFHLLPQDVRVSVGDTFAITVAIENVTVMSAWQVYLCFDPARLECVGVSFPSGHIFSSSVTVSSALGEYNSTEFPQGPLRRVQNDEGWVLAGDCLLGMSQPAFTGSGLLCRIDFKAISPGPTALALLHDFAHEFQTYTLEYDIEAITAPSISYSNIFVVSP